jgi:hypothetical protein
VARFARVCGGRKVTRAVMPSSPASRTNPSGEARPLPDGPPATTTRTPGSFAAARSTISGAFSGWMRPTKATTCSSSGSPSAVRAARRSPGWNTSRSTPGWTTSIRLGIGAMNRNQLSCFILGVDDEPVCLVDDLLLANGAQRRLGPVTIGQRRVLHRGQGVRGMHQRHRPAVPSQPADLTRQPVVRVHDVVVTRFVGRFGAQHPGRESRTAGWADRICPDPRTVPPPRCAPARRAPPVRRADRRTRWPG